MGLLVGTERNRTCKGYQDRTEHGRGKGMIEYKGGLGRATAPAHIPVPGGPGCIGT